MKMNRTFVGLLILLVGGAVAMAAEKPNVLFIAIDDLRPELGCYGGAQVQTPHLDSLASQGMRFDRAYCQVAVCGASRASLMTGILPTAKRFVKYTSRADQDAPGAATLPETFKKAGYTTISNGKIFHNRADTAKRSWSEPAWGPQGGHALSLDPLTRQKLSGRKRGRIYELPVVPDNAYGDGKIAEKTIKDLQRLKQAGKPFFIGCGFIRPHMPFYAPKRYWDLYNRDKIQIADNRYRPKQAPAALKGSGEFRSYHLADFKVGSDAWHRMMRHGYMASVSYVDKLVGDVMAELERLELADSTIVVVWGDHGWHLGEHDFWGKHNTMHLATRVPLIVRVPGKAGGSSESLVETSDLFPTLCGLAGLAVPNTVQGRSFGELFDSPDQPFRDVAYCRYGPGDAGITKRFSYTRYRGGVDEMLYDLEKDPNENENVAGKPEYKETVKRMKQLLEERQAEAAGAKGVKDIAGKARETTEKTVPETVAGAGAQKAPGYEGDVPMPTHSGVRYGEHERHVLDFWQAESEKPTPLVMVVHGGGWSGGSKERMMRFADAPALLKAGISVAAINYRLMKHSQDVAPPVKAPLHDAARALQFLRSKAKDWNIDPTRIGAAGGSAGACSSLWLLYHDDLADPESADPVERQSSRLNCAAVMGAQTTLDPVQMKEWTPNSKYGGHAFGKKNFAEFLADREEIQPWIAEYSPYALATPDDPPVAIFYNGTPSMGKEQRDPTHTANFGVGLQRRCEELGIGCDIVYPSAPDVKHETATDYLIDALKGGR
jgi:iduronate 2-sulfatase